MCAGPGCPSQPSSSCFDADSAMPPKGAAPKAPPLRPAEVKAPPAKKARADDVGPVPAVRPRAPAAGQPPVPVNPELPQPESTDVDVVMVMRGVIEYVKVT